MNSMPLSIVWKANIDEGFITYLNATTVTANDISGDTPYILAYFYSEGDWFYLYWTANGIQTEFPGK